MSRTKGSYKAGSQGKIIHNTFLKLGGKISKEDIEKVIIKFWGREGVFKYLKGTDSFSVKQMFFFPVNKNKKEEVLTHKRALHNKRMKKYLKKRRKKERKTKRSL